MSETTKDTLIIAIVGPTASGKSTLGIDVALEINGEIINCDSVQVYKEIQIATAKVPFEERKGVPHHLIDFVSPNVNYTAGEWAREAAAKIEEIEARGHMPLLVGGTGFYLRALRQPLFVSPPTDESLRRRLNKIREKYGAEHIHRLLRRIDRAAAQRQPAHQGIGREGHEREGGEEQVAERSPKKRRVGLERPRLDDARLLHEIRQRKE